MCLPFVYVVCPWFIISSIIIIEIGLMYPSMDLTYDVAEDDLELLILLLLPSGFWMGL